MKKIQLSDGIPSNVVGRIDLTKQGERTLEVIKECLTAGKLSYTEINTILFLADREIYIETITKPLNGGNENE